MGTAEEALDDLTIICRNGECIAGGQVVTTGNIWRAGIDTKRSMGAYGMGNNIFFVVGNIACWG